MTSISHSAGGYQEINYRPDIDGLRAVAVLSVITFHAFPVVAPGGFVGVDIFFVISGYLISSIILKGLDADGFSFKQFYLRRILRIFPALIVVLGVCLTVGWFVLVAYKYQQLGEQIIAGSVFLANFLFWRQSGYFDTLAEAKPLLHLWSLGVEEQFYIIWPLTLYLCYRLRRSPLSLILTIAVFSFALNVREVRTDASSAFYLPHTRFWELLVGATLACINLHPRQPAKTRITEVLRGAALIPLADVQAYAGICLIAAALHLIQKDMPFPGWRALLPTFGAVLLIAAGPRAQFNRLVLSNRFIVLVGLISYPLYLWHWPVLYFVRTMVLNPSAPYLAGALALSIILAWLTYTFVELPLRRGKAQWDTLKWSASAAAAAMISVFGAGAAIDTVNGVPNRAISTAASVLQYHKYNYWSDYRNDYCLLFGTEETFSPICVEENKMAAGAPVLAIWGDSHGAHLYRGIKDNPGSSHYAIAQFTSSSCPPVFDFDKLGVPPCRHINDTVRKIFQAIRPSVVILAHDWPQSLSANENSLAQLAPTVDVLRKIGANRIILVGPIPHWNPTLPDVLEAYLRQHDGSSIPPRLQSGLDPTMNDIDRRLADLTAKLNIEYISPIHELCNVNGCLTLVPGSNNVPMAWDAAHFTREASRYFINLIAAKLFVGPSVKTESSVSTGIKNP